MPPRNGEDRICLNCKDIFYVKRKNMFLRDKGKYCSKECFYEHRKSTHTVIVKCEICDKEILSLKSRKRTTCSRECFYKSMINNLKNPWFKKDHSGENSPTWKGGITPLHVAIRNSKYYSEWRLNIFIRDNFTCQMCFSKNREIEAHHKNISFSELFRDFLDFYSQFSPIEDKESLIRIAESYKPFWDENNMETLCKSCHDKVGLHKGKLNRYGK